MRRDHQSDLMGKHRKRRKLYRIENQEENSTKHCESFQSTHRTAPNSASQPGKPS